MANRHLILKAHLLGAALVFSLSGALSQPDLQTQLSGKNTLKEVMEVVNAYYEGKPENWHGNSGDEGRLKDWKRWEWYMSGRLGPNGVFVDIPRYLEKADRMAEAMVTDQSRSINSHWSTEGPLGSDATGIGRADRIAFHPTNAGTFYVGTPAGGLWKTTNFGTNWTPLTDHIPSLGISGIVVNQSEPNEIFILTGDSDSEYIAGFVNDFGYCRKSVGVLRSVNGGVTWFKTAPLDNNPLIAFKMVQQPTDPNVLLVATSLGIYRTTNKGASWTLVRSGECFDVEFLPGTQYAVAAGKTEVVWSLSGGAAWGVSTLNVAWNNPSRLELEVTPANPTMVYLLVGGVPADSTYDGTYRSTNSGVTFTQQGTVPNILGNQQDGGGHKNQSKYDLGMAVSPTNTNIVVTSAVRIWRSTNAGQNYSYAQTQPHPDIHDLAYNPLDGILYGCTDGGVYRSLDDGNTWEALWSGMATSQMYHMTGTLLDNNKFLAGFQDNGVKSRIVAGTYWEHVLTGDGFDVSYYPNDATKFYLTENMKVFRKDGSLEPITPFPNSDGDKEWFGTVAAHVTDPEIVFVGYKKVYRSYDNGDNWENVGANGSWSLATCPSNGNRIYSVGLFGGDDGYLAGNASMWRSDDLGDNWTSLSYKPGFPGGGQVTKVTDIGVCPVNSDYVYVTAGGFDSGKKVYQSTDAGESWENWSGSLPNMPINCIAVASDFSVYIGTDIGVFYRAPAMNDWMPFRNSLPNIPVTDLFINENNGKIYASTFGRGMWSAAYVTDCPGSLVTFGDIDGYVHYQASLQINTTNVVNAGLGNALHLKAGGLVIMKPGFVAKQTSIFTAQIGGCGTGGIPGED